MEEAQACRSQSGSVASSSMLVMPATLGLDYLAAGEIAACAEKFRGHILGMAAFGSSAGASAAYPVATQVNMLVLSSDTLFEVWTSSEPVTLCDEPPITASKNNEVLYGSIDIHPAPGEKLAATTHRAYATIFSFIQRQRYPHLLRIWNYFPQINVMEDGLERYRSFNVGRHQAFLEQETILTAENIPAACALGSQGDSLTIYFLAAKQAGQAVENPRQMPAYHYPELFGPRSPLFSRALLMKSGSQQYLFISGTASIVGCETLHAGDISQQTQETLVNVRTLLKQAAGHGAEAFPAGRLLLKVYLRQAQDFPLVRRLITAEFGPSHQAVYLQSDICRADLLVEIEGLHISNQQPVL
ncbi:MAG: hypothetical protein Q7S51_11470 [Gallionellaceae bacterium]|nr:hypothetical protein [Gallionellaceae bacterium]